MSNTTTTKLNLDQARLFGALVARPNEPVDMDYGDLIDTLDALPGYTEFVFEMVATQTDRQWRLMARDMPQHGRRYTNLDTGMEWIDLNGIVAADPDVYGIAVRTERDGAMVAMAAVGWR
jgi:hypothetical protein